VDKFNKDLKRPGAVALEFKEWKGRTRSKSNFFEDNGVVDGDMFPKLSKYMKSGTIKYNKENEEYEGITADKLPTTFGKDKQAVEAYLNKHPKPSD